ncbi:hypothetical protein RI367_004827 [Sorochytrium milnesiophthora]
MKSAFLLVALISCSSTFFNLVAAQAGDCLSTVAQTCLDGTVTRKSLNCDPLNNPNLPSVAAGGAGLLPYYQCLCDNAGEAVYCYDLCPESESGALKAAALGNMNAQCDAVTRLKASLSTTTMTTKTTAQATTTTSTQQSSSNGTATVSGNNTATNTTSGSGSGGRIVPTPTTPAGPRPGAVSFQSTSERSTVVTLLLNAAAAMVGLVAI